jgi:beta-lactamase regulating signal transducer with metallopeptidase domain
MEPIFGTRINLFIVLMSIWLSVALVFMIRFFCLYRKMVKVIYQFQKQDDQIEHLTQQANADFRGRRPPRILVSTAVCAPMVIGIYRGTIVLPNMHYYPEELKWILKHENMHVAQKDVLLKLLAEIICCLFWWNPMIHLLHKDLEQILEIKCDLNVTRNTKTEEKKHYLETLVNALRREKEISTNETELQYSLTGSMKFFSSEIISLKERFNAISKYNGIKQGRSIQTLIIVFSICLFVLSYSVVFQTYFEPPDVNIEGFEMMGDEVPAIIGVYVSNDGETYEMILSNGTAVQIQKEYAVGLLESGIHMVTDDKS